MRGAHERASFDSPEDHDRPDLIRRSSRARERERRRS
jgi:hypothetical protein